ncbi:MAG: hypothetical protein MUF06_01180 [Pirellulaceae bacterium]|nr:hypothetical protein [Pirellulaceae bacterium]
MASRTMNYLRKNQKTVLVIMGVVLMFTFTIGGSLSFLTGPTLFSGSTEGGAVNPVVATWRGGKIREDDLQKARMLHLVTVNFLRQLLMLSVERGGEPVVGGQPIPKGTQLGQIAQIDPGIPADASEFSLVRTMLLAKKADELKVAVDRESARQFLRGLNIEFEVPEAEWPQIARDVIGDNLAMSYDQLLDHLAFELKAQHVRMMSQAGLFSVSPAAAWEYHNRLNRRFAIEAYPVETAAFVSKVTETPSDAVLRDLFLEGRTRDPNPSIAEPAFRQPQRIAFDYLRVDFQPFLEKAKQTITDEQVAKQYELDITQGKHKVLALPDNPAVPATPASPATPTEPKPDNEPAAVKPDGGNPPEEPSAANTPAEDKPAESKPDTQEPDKKLPPEPSADAPPAAKADEPAASEAKAEQQPAETPAEPAPCQVEDTAAETEPTAEPTDQPAVEKPSEAPATVVESAAAEPPGATESPVAPPVDPSAPPPPPAGESTPPISPPTEAPKFKPLSEVQDEIRTTLAQSIAQEAMSKAVSAAIAEISQHGSKLRRWEAAQEAKRKSTTVVDPGKLPLAEIAQRHGFTFESIPLVDRFQVAKFEIGRNVMEFDRAALQMGRFNSLSFADIAFVPGESLYTPQQVNASLNDVSYIFWRTAEESAKELTFADAKPAVLKFWKDQQAFKLAGEEAVTLAKKAADAKSLREVLDPSKVIDVAPFSWLSAGSLTFGANEPTLSTVPEIELAGQEFMRGVFSLSPGETGTAPNQPETRVYVVRVVSQAPDDNILRQMFVDSGMNFQLMSVAQRETFETAFKWYEGLEREMNLVWERPADSSRGS